MNERMRLYLRSACRVLLILAACGIVAGASAERPVDGWGHGRKERVKGIFERVKNAWDPTESVNLVFSKGRFAHPIEPATVVTKRAAKGYIIEVGSSLYERAKTDGQIAFVLSHEMAHVVQGHLDDVMPHADEVSAGSIVAEPQADACGEVVERSCQDAPAPKTIAEMEDEADRSGKQYAVKAGFGAKEAVKVFDLKDDWAWTLGGLDRHIDGAVAVGLGNRDRLARDQAQ